MAVHDDWIRLDELELTQEHQRALEVLESGQNVFLTGRAGTGKSSFVKAIIAAGEDRGLVDSEWDFGEIMAVAPTGIAAIELGGTTIHRLFGVDFRNTPQSLGSFTQFRDELKAVDLLIIDEVSMVRADLMDAMDARLREVRGEDRPTDADKPFGGVQVLMTGDPYQLPPVIKRAEAEKMAEVYEGPHFFDARVFKGLEIEAVELKKVFRQDDLALTTMLDAVRDGDQSADTLEKINAYVDPRFQVPVDEKWLTISSRNDRVQMINAQRLATMPGQRYQYRARIKGSFKTNLVRVPEVLELAVGAQVMMVKNDRYMRWANGSLGEITALGRDSIEVLVHGHRVQLERQMWSQNRYEKKTDPQTGEERIVNKSEGTFEQFPIVLAWAITIHKAQGQTVERLYVDLENEMFADGQLYVALSRCTHPEGLVISREVRAHELRADRRAQAFMQRLQQVSV